MKVRYLQSFRDHFLAKSKVFTKEKTYCCFVLVNLTVDWETYQVPAVKLQQLHFLPVTAAVRTPSTSLVGGCEWSVLCPVLPPAARLARLLPK